MSDRAIIGGLTIFAALALFLACLLGSTPLSPARVLAAILGAGQPGDGIVVWDIRLPRALAAFLVGAALGASGAAMQGLLRNPLAEPGVLGVTATASLGATFAVHFGLVALAPVLMPLFSIVGALAATAALAFAAARITSIVTIILVGVGLSSLAGALTALIMNFAPNPFTLADMINWMLGSVANRSFADLALAGPFLAAGFIALYTARRGLTALSLGEEAASAIGLDLRRSRLAIIVGAGFASGAAVMIAGSVGFVGLIAPHFVRPWVGHDPARTVVPAALVAGTLLVLADVMVRLLPTTSELKLGVVAALVGAPVFAAIALQRRSHHE